MGAHAPPRQRRQLPPRLTGLRGAAQAAGNFQTSGRVIGKTAPSIDSQSWHDDVNSHGWLGRDSAFTGADTR